MTEKTIRNLERHHFKASYFASIDELKEHTLPLLKEFPKVAFGGSTTLVQTGLKDFIEKNAVEVIERVTGGTDEEKIESERRALLSDLYLCSSNAISSTGLLVNIDKRGNRTGAIVFGPRRVLVISSVKKITDTDESAIERAKNTAAVKNCDRFDLDTPCRKVRKCVDCESERNICYVTVLTKRSYPHGRIEVCLIDGDYGF